MKRNFIALKNQSYGDVLCRNLSEQLSVYDGVYFAKYCSCTNSIFVYTKTSIFTCYLFDTIIQFCSPLDLIFTVFVEQENPCSGLVIGRPCIEIKLS